MPSNVTDEFPKDFRTARLKEVYQKVLEISQPAGPPTASTPEGPAESALRCQLHGSPTEMYCISCKDILCQECVETHKKHSYGYLIEKYAMGRNFNLQEQQVPHKNVLDDDSHQLLANPTTSKDHDSWRRKPQERDTKETCDKEDMELQYENQ